MATTNLFEDGASPQYRPVGGPAETGYVDQRVQWAVKQITKAEPKVNKWRTLARESYRFRDNKQLSAADERSLKDQGRPTTAFNTTQKFIRYVSGVQRDSPIAVLFNAIDFNNDQIQQFSDQITRYHEWVYQKADTNDALARAFEDHLVTGLGVVNNFIDHAKDPRGLIGTPRVDPQEFFWPDTLEINIKNTRWLARETFVDREEAKAMFPSSYAQFLIDMSNSDGASPMTTWPVVDKVLYKIPYVQTYPLDTLQSGRSSQRSDKIKLLEFQCWHNQEGFVFEDPLDQTEQWMTAMEFAEYDRQLSEQYHIEIKDYEPRTGRKWERNFILNRKYLLEEPSALPGSRFTFNCIASHFDEEDRIPYGFMRVLIDPQRYANKFFNQMIEINAKQAKGGVIVEMDAFADKAQLKEFEDTYAQAGSVNFVEQGGIAKIKEKQLPQASQGTMAIMEFINASMQNVTGISEDSLGIGASTAAGVTLKRRQRAGMALLASEFDAEALFRKDEGYIIYDHLKLIADNRLIRVGGFYEGEVMKLEDAPFSLDYEIELDDIERDPNMKQYLAELVMGPWGQTAMRSGWFIPDFLKVLPIPRRWVLNIIQQMNAKQQRDQQMAALGIPTAGGRGAKKSVPELKALIENRQADTLLKKSKAAGVLAKAQHDNQQQGNDTMSMVFDMLRQGLDERRQNQQHEMDMAGGAADIVQGFMPKNGAGNGQ